MDSFEIVKHWRKENVTSGYGGLAHTDWNLYLRQHSFGQANHNQPKAWIKF